MHEEGFDAKVKCFSKFFSRFVMFIINGGINMSFITQEVDCFPVKGPYNCETKI